MSDATLITSLTNTRAHLLEQLRAAADPPPVLIAVTKTQSDDVLTAILVAGQRVFGENRVQEALSHWQHRRALYPDLELRLIGPLQTNKAEDAVRLFDVIETLDRLKLAQALAQAVQKTGRNVRFLIQVNTGEEPQKAGVAPIDLAGLLEASRALGLKPEGLMCIPPEGEPAAPHFHLLAQLARQHDLKTLSMGMSADFITAAKLGATHVRLGSILFGARPTL